MYCPRCGVKTKVIKTEMINDTTVYRVRICPNCGKIIKTIEQPEGKRK